MSTAAHPHGDQLRNPDGSPKYTNRLIDETSPYLLQHAHNPVDWRPWGSEAFEKARGEDKPIFLSIGYATCYWCHVMAREVFEDAALAEQLNERFIPIKVDREERPDVDEVYMTATQLMTGRGGWPMNTCLTPPGARDGGDSGLRPYWAGTYIPPEPMHGMPGFGQVVEALARTWRDQRQEALDQADRVAAAVADHLQASSTEGGVGPSLVEQAANQLLRTYDAEHGGFGGAPKFPQPTQLSFLLAVHRHTGDEPVRRAIERTLDAMARGGMYDQVGGGFHRYSTDARWEIPHFEKMLYDNGQLLELYARAAACGLGSKAPATETDKPQAASPLCRVLRETCGYVLREMRDPTGAFWSAQDAEVEGREGGNYLWTREQVDQAMADEPELGELAGRMYGLDRGPNFQDPHNPGAEPAHVLFLPQPLFDLAEHRGESEETIQHRRRRINRRLKRRRDRRPQPATDDKILTSWNGLMIGGLARAGRSLDAPPVLDAAERAAEAVLQNMLDPEDGLLRVMRGGEVRIEAFLEDYAHLVHGLIELHRAGRGNGRYLDSARRCTEAAIDRFAADAGGYHDTPTDPELFVRPRVAHDGAAPSGNSQMIHNLLDLHELTGERAWLKRAANDLRSFGGPLTQQPLAMVHMAHALLRALELAPDHFGQPEGEPADGAAAGPVSVSAEPAAVDLTHPGARAELTVQVVIAGDHHLHAPGTDSSEMIPLELGMKGGEHLNVEVTYPDARRRTLPFADQPLAVYEGSVTLRVRLTRSASGTGASPSAPRLVLHHQACTDTACLAPASIEVPVEVRT